MGWWIVAARVEVRPIRAIGSDTDVIHLLIAGARIKSVRSHLSAADLAGLLTQGGRPSW
ncbi:hypothetical protein AB0K04_13445 [Micromonospora coxensis]|uniref:hypothetical protein n=1 Tax=Micromonospora coxensis TaxID=356852 RepID=UPI00342B04FD